MYRIKLITNKSMGKIMQTKQKPAKKFKIKIIYNFGMEIRKHGKYWTSIQKHLHCHTL